MNDLLYNLRRLITLGYDNVWSTVVIGWQAVFRRKMCGSIEGSCIIRVVNKPDTT